MYKQTIAMRLSPIIKTQEDFNNYLDSNGTYFELMFELVEVYQRLHYTGKEIYSPIPIDGNLLAIIDLKEDVYFHGYKVIFK